MDWGLQLVFIRLSGDNKDKEEHKQEAAWGAAPEIERHAPD